MESDKKRFWDFCKNAVIAIRCLDNGDYGGLCKHCHRAIVMSESKTKCKECGGKTSW